MAKCKFKNQIAKINPEKNFNPLDIVHKESSADVCPDSRENGKRSLDERIQNSLQERRRMVKLHAERIYQGTYPFSQPRPQGSFSNNLERKVTGMVKKKKSPEDNVAIFILFSGLSLLFYCFSYYLHTALLLAFQSL